MRGCEQVESLLSLLPLLPTIIVHGAIGPHDHGAIDPHDYGAIGLHDHGAIGPHDHGAHAIMVTFAMLRDTQYFLYGTG